MNTRIGFKNMLYISYFGTEERSVRVFSWRAYRDLCRTLNFKESGDKKKTNNIHLMFRRNICAVIEKSIINLPDKEKDFDLWHRESCQDIIKEANKAGLQLKFGQAQKWLNMTLKYMWLTGTEKDKLSKLQNKLHVPIDNYILEELAAKIPIKRGWSRLDYDAYIQCQNVIRSEHKIPIEWEIDIWNKTADSKYREELKRVNSI